MKKIKLGFFAIVFIFTFTSCDDLFDGTILEVDLSEHTSELAPYAFFKDTDTILTVMVGKSVGILDNSDPTVVEGATVELYKNGALLYTFIYADSIKGYQIALNSTFSPTVGETYELRVAAPGFESVSATQIIPPPVPIQNVEYEALGTVDQFGNPMDVYKVTFVDPKDIANFYEIEGTLNYSFMDWDSTVYKGSYNLYFESNDPNFSDGTITDSNFDGVRYTLRLQSYPISIDPNDETTKIKVYLRAVSVDYATFKSSLNKLWSTQGNPFAEPVLLHTNMSGGLGLFGVLSTSEFEL